MKVTSITFSVTRSIPVEPMSGKERDRYASIRPNASVTVELDGEVDLTHFTATESTTAKRAIQEAFDFAADRCHEQLAAYGKELRELYAESHNRKDH